MKKIKIVLTGGGTGGHLFPLVAVSKYLVTQYPEKKIKFIFFGPKAKLEQQIIGRENIKIRHIFGGKLRRYFSWRYLIDLIKFPLGLVQSAFWLLVDMPDVIFAKGGYVAVPVVFMAWLYRIPILIHESDAQPGIANQFMGSIANRVAISFERARIHFQPSKTFISGTPISQRVLGGSVLEAKKILGITKVVKPILLILGGSQGARLINREIVQMLKKLVKKYQVIHQTGERDYKSVVAEAQRIGFKIGASDYYPVAFIGEEIKHFYALADVVISRAGSTTITDLAANAKVTILVPITYSANNHQRLNAFEVARLGGAIVLEENNFKTSMILLRLKELTEDRSVREKLSQKIQIFYNPQATKILADELLKLC